MVMSTWGPQIWSFRLRTYLALCIKNLNFLFLVFEDTFYCRLLLLKWMTSVICSFVTTLMFWRKGVQNQKVITSLEFHVFRHSGVVRKREAMGDAALIKTKLFPCASPVFIPEPALLDVRSVFSWPRDKGQEMPWQDTCNLCWFLTFQDVEGIRMSSVKTVVLICFFLSLSSPALMCW